MSVSQSISRTTSFRVYERRYLRTRTATTDLGVFREPAHPLGGDGFVLALQRDKLERPGRFVEEPGEAFCHQYLPAARARLQPRRGVYDITDGREVAHGVRAADISTNASL